MTSPKAIDILIVGSGMGGASCAAGLAPSGAQILILERGERLIDSPEARDARAIFQRGVFRPQESWIDGAGKAFNPGNYYYVGGNTKLYGAVLIRYRAARLPADRTRRRRDTGLAVRLRRVRALVHARGGAVSSARRARSGSDRAAPFGALSFSPGPR